MQAAEAELQRIDRDLLQLAQQVERGIAQDPEGQRTAAEQAIGATDSADTAQVEAEGGHADSREAEARAWEAAGMQSTLGLAAERSGATEAGGQPDEFESTTFLTPESNSVQQLHPEQAGTSASAQEIPEDGGHEGAFERQEQRARLQARAQEIRQRLLGMLSMVDEGGAFGLDGQHGHGVPDYLDLMRIAMQSGEEDIPGLQAAIEATMQVSQWPSATTENS